MCVFFTCTVFLPCPPVYFFYFPLLPVHTSCFSNKKRDMALSPASLKECSMKNTGDDTFFFFLGCFDHHSFVFAIDTFSLAKCTSYSRVLMTTQRCYPSTHESDQSLFRLHVILDVETGIQKILFANKRR
jgi:hypothetical protein